MSISKSLCNRTLWLKFLLQNLIQHNNMDVRYALGSWFVCYRRNQIHIIFNTLNLLCTKDVYVLHSSVAILSSWLSSWVYKEKSPLEKTRQDPFLHQYIGFRAIFIVIFDVRGRGHFGHHIEFAKQILQSCHIHMISYNCIETPCSFMMVLTYIRLTWWCYAIMPLWTLTVILDCGRHLGLWPSSWSMDAIMDYHCHLEFM